MTIATTGKLLEFADFQTSQSNGESTKTDDVWESKISQTAKPVQAGKYQVTYNAQIYGVTGQQVYCEVRLVIDSVTVCSDHTAVGDLLPKQSNGIGYLDYAGGAEPVISLEFRRQGGSGTVGIKVANVGLVKVQD